MFKRCIIIENLNINEVPGENMPKERMVDTISGKNVAVSATLHGPDRIDFSTPVTITVGDIIFGAIFFALIGAGAHSAFWS